MRLSKYSERRSWASCPVGNRLSHLCDRNSEVEREVWRWCCVWVGEKQMDSGRRGNVACRRIAESKKLLISKEFPNREERKQYEFATWSIACFGCFCCCSVLYPSRIVQNRTEGRYLQQKGHRKVKWTTLGTLQTLKEWGEKFRMKNST